MPDDAPLSQTPVERSDLPDLTRDQQAAHDAILPFLAGHTDHGVMVLEGWAGTGKTTLVAYLLRGFPKWRVAVAAPTNKAVRVLRDKLIEAGAAVADSGEPDELPSWRSRKALPPRGITCRSIHSLLGLKLAELDNGQHEARTHRDSTLRDYQVVIVDECSMLDDDLFQRVILERGNARILFVGDSAQLPPVKAGPGLSPVFSRVNAKCTLTSVIRQAADNPIIQLSVAIRRYIEAGIRVSAASLTEALPPSHSEARVVLVGGDASMLVDWWLAQHEAEPETDTRIIAYTNDRVLDYNRRIHQALHGETLTRFVAGERVVVHSQCKASKVVNDHLMEEGVLITSEELRVLKSEPAAHPFYPKVGAERLLLQADDGASWRVWVAADDLALNQAVSAYFADWRRFKSDSEATADSAEKERLKEAAREASNRGWALKRTFAPLRHAYAITCHKSQGSTFDCALVDFSDLSRMPDVHEFNRALYVAVTRSRQYLAMVVS